MLLSDGDLRKEFEAGRLLLEPWDPAMLQPSSIDVRLDRFFRVFQNSRYTHIDPAQQQDELTSAVEPAGDDPFVLHPGEFVLGSTFESVGLPDDLAGRLEGKALAVDTPIPTPTGWRRMGELRAGEEVFGSDGRAYPVVAATAAMRGRPCYEVCFSDGQSIVADAGHLWLTTTGAQRQALVTTADIAADVGATNEHPHLVAASAPVDYAERPLQPDPGELGRQLATGAALRVPTPYLQASVAQRRALLHGLVDASRHVDESGSRLFVSVREELSDAVVELAAGLGLLPVKRKRPMLCDGVDLGVVYEVTLAPWPPMVTPPNGPHRGMGRRRFRTITEVRPVATRPVRCIQVAAPDGMFLAGPTFIPTHNSSLGRLGLLTHSTAGFIDPGFTGHITLELSNVANLPITLWPGMKIGQLCLFRLSSPAERPYGSAGVGSRYQGQRGPTPSRAHLNFQRVDTRRR